ncbi:MAG: PHP domain-containing protein [Bacilli bacterium]|nr:PHP domain-containing protein [Bacilli bacterium]
MLINLHSHSNYSDGVNPPSKVIDLFADESLDLVALTDHDTIFGLEEAKKRSKEKGITFLSGIEFSTSLADTPLSFANDYTVCHILAYGFDIDMMKERIKEHHAKMKAGVTALIKELKELGYDVDTSELPNNDFWISIDVARLLVKKGYSNNVWATFGTIISKAKNRRMFFVNPKDIISLIHDCGGLAFLAHPFDIIQDDMKVRVPLEATEELIPYLISIGIDGLEAHYSAYSQERQAYIEDVANKSNLLISYGTDFHGGRSYKETMYVEVKPLPKWIEQLLNKKTI